MFKWLRRFDKEYWQMRQALGYPMPLWTDQKWRLSCTENPVKCGTCEAARKYPRLHAAHLIKMAEGDPNAMVYKPRHRLSAEQAATLLAKIPLSADDLKEAV